MNSNNTLHVKDINQYHQHFRDQAVEFSRGPSQNRRCQDKCCFVLFLLITIGFVAMGVYYIQAAKLSDLSENYFGGEKAQHLGQTENQFPGIQNLKPAVPVIIGMICLAVVTAVVFLLLLMKFPQCMFYSMLAFATLLMIVLIIVLVASANYIPAIIIAVILLIFACVLLCNKDKIKIGIVLLNTAANFLSQKKTVFLAPFFMLIFIVVFQAFWIASFVGIILYKGDAQSNASESQVDDQQNQNSFVFMIWSFFHIFYSVFFNYCLVFIIATACGMWYYNIDSNYLTTAVSRIIRFHVGSFTFASILVTIVTMMRQAAQQQQRQGGAFSLCLCLVSCCLSFIEDLLETLNHNAIIVMSVTGESYINSAKSTISLIFDNFSLFFVVDIISSIIQFTGILLICGVPSLVGYFLLRETAENPDDHTFVAIGMVAIILISILIGVLFLGVLSEALSCIFIFYCFDRKFHEMGFQITNQVPHEMRALFESLESSLNPNMNSGQRGYHGQSYEQNNYNPHQNQQPYGQNPYQSNPYQQNPNYNPHSDREKSQNGYPNL